MIGMDSREMLAEFRLAHWAGVLARRVESGLSIRQFCEDEGIRENTYYYWQKKLREIACEQIARNHEEVSMHQGFAEVRVAELSSEGVLMEGESVSMITQQDKALSAITPPNHATVLGAKQVGQIQIEVSGVKISADGTYPVDKLARVLKGLVRA